MPHPTNETTERTLSRRLQTSLIGAVLALMLGFVAAHYYSVPNLNGAARDNPWLERDFCFALASSLLALGVGLHAGGGVVRPRVLAQVLGHVLFWIALTIALALAWGTSVSLLTLLIAPSHAFALLRLVALGRALRAERLWRK